jgi:hypothetical protein
VVAVEKKMRGSWTVRVRSPRAAASPDSFCRHRPTGRSTARHLISACGRRGTQRRNDEVLVRWLHVARHRLGSSDGLVDIIGVADHVESTNRRCPRGWRMSVVSMRISVDFPRHSAEA